jgi:hypothetical protein
LAQDRGGRGHNLIPGLFVQSPKKSLAPFDGKKPLPRPVIVAIDIHEMQLKEPG